MPAMRAASSPGRLLFGQENAAFGRARRGAAMAAVLVEPIL